jgi:hypothetical protein
MKTKPPMQAMSTAKESRTSRYRASQPSGAGPSLSQHNNHTMTKTTTSTSELAPSTLRASSAAWSKLMLRSASLMWAFVCLFLTAVGLHAQNPTRQLSLHKPSGTPTPAPLDVLVGNTGR